MDKLIAYCGINCKSCPLYIATKNDDIVVKQELSLKWGKLYNRSFDIENMSCHGCKSGKKFFLSEQCDITTCNTVKGIETCKQCTNHPCDRIEKFYAWQKNNKTDVEIVGL